MTLTRAELVEAIGKLPPNDLKEIARYFEEMFGLPFSVLEPPKTEAQVSLPEETERYDVVLKGVGARRIAVIVEVRDIADLGDVREAKHLVDRVEIGESQVLKKDVDPEEAERIKWNLGGLGAEVELRPSALLKPSSQKRNVYVTGTEGYEYVAMTEAIADVSGKKWEEAVGLLQSVLSHTSRLLVQGVSEEKAKEIKAKLEKTGLIVEIK